MILSSPAELKELPQRIISLVPSQTELLAHLGLDEHTIGITKFCVHPPGWRTSKMIVGGTKNLQMDKIKALSPDLVIANKEENTREQIEELAKIYPVWVTDVNDLDSALAMINDIGALTGTVTRAADLIRSIKTCFEEIHRLAAFINTAYLIWKDPYISVGGDTFIHDMLQRCGFNNIFKDQNRYPSLQLEDLIQRQCQLCLLSTEPYPFKEQHLQTLQQQLPQVKFKLVDGEFFSWYGSRLLAAPAYFDELIRSVRQDTQEQLF